jgi:hypothetical protein
MTALARAKVWADRIFPWFVARFATFGAAILITHQLPGWLKGPAWIGVLALGVWAFFALVRDVHWAWDRGMPRLRRFWRRGGQWVHRHRFLWAMLAVACGLLLAGLALSRGWPAWVFLATSSLREDEILNIDRYTSQGFAPAVGTYNLARNHIFFNVVNAVLPGADSTAPWRGRFVSFAAVLGALGLLVGYAAYRRWFVAGVAAAGLIFVDLAALLVLLEGRGYGLITFFGTAAAVAFAEWLRTRRGVWLKGLAVCVVLGTYTLPYFIVFGGLLVLAAFFHRPRRETFLTGCLALAAIAMLYLPVLHKVLGVALGYDEEYGDTVTSNFGDIAAVYRTMQYFVSYDIARIGPLFLLVVLLGTLLFLSFGRFALAADRVATAGVAAAILGTLVFLFVLRSVPIRVSAFLAGPQAFLFLVMAGSVLAARGLAPVRPLVLLGFTGAMAAVFWNATITDPLLPRQNWRGFAQIIARALPPETPVWVGRKYAKLMRWHAPDRKFLDGDLDPSALAAGQVAAFEASFKEGDVESRLPAEALSPGLRFVTAPLLINYQRLYFLPPPDRGVLAVTVDGRSLTVPQPGRQPVDPVMLSDSYGHGDVLAESPGPLAAENLTLPVTVTVSVAPAETRRFLQVLFSQTLADKMLRAEGENSAGRWQETPLVVFGELASLDVPPGVRSVRVRVEARPDFPPPPNGSGERPAFTVMDAWVR